MIGGRSVPTRPLSYPGLRRNAAPFVTDKSVSTKRALPKTAQSNALTSSIESAMMDVLTGTISRVFNPYIRRPLSNITMPRGPRGEKRPTNPFEAAIVVGRIATGELEDAKSQSAKDPAAVSLGRRGGLKGGKARAAKLSPRKRTEIAKKAAQSRWRKM
jgi:hypothetical protein